MRWHQLPPAKFLLTLVFVFDNQKFVVLCHGRVPPWLESWTRWQKGHNVTIRRHNRNRMQHSTVLLRLSFCFYSSASICNADVCSAHKITGIDVNHGLGEGIYRGYSVSDVHVLHACSVAKCLSSRTHIRATVPSHYIQGLTFKFR